jgi:predicted sugar kinase
MQLLPALVEADLLSFGQALSSVQRITGSWFADVQGGVFARGQTEQLVASMADWGAAGVGQSSWGPAVYGLVESAGAAAELAGLVGRAMGTSGSVFQGHFAARGAQVQRGSRTLQPD